MNYQKLQDKATKLITKYGMKAKLRRAGVDRSCIIVIMDRDPQEHQGQLLDQVGLDILMSAKGLSPIPDMGKDVLVTLDPITGVEKEKLRIVRPPERFAPGGIDIYWELKVKL